MLENCTFGMEIEAGGMKRRTILPDGCKWCTKDGSIINPNGVGNDPKGVYNLIGGEIQTRACNSEQELADLVVHILKITDAPVINIPTAMHVHIKIPAFLDPKNIETVKSFMLWNQDVYPKLVKYISKLPDLSMITRDKYSNDIQYKNALRTFKDKSRSRFSVLTEKQVSIVKSSTAKNVDELVNSLAINKDGKPLWSIFKRTGVNFKKMRSVDIGTIEFRTFNATSNPEEILNIISFPRQYIQCFLDGMTADQVIEKFKNVRYPSDYGWIDDDEKLAMTHYYTDHDKMKRTDIINYIEKKLLQGEILLKDLDYPEFWIKKLGSEYERVLSYSKN